jgi:RNA polymerase sigma-70 factor (sigma-E family)
MITKSVALGTLPESGVRAAATNFDDAYPGLYRSAYRIAFRILGGREEAADLAQEACARAYSRWSRVGGFDSPDAWVTRVTGNLALDLLRRRRTASRHAENAGAPDSREPDGDRVDLQRALLSLSRRQRDVVLLRFVADLSEAAVAAALGCSVGSVKAHASRGLATLRTTLGKEID